MDNNEQQYQSIPSPFMDGEQEAPVVTPEVETVETVPVTEETLPAQAPGMTEDEITADRKARYDACMADINSILGKHEFTLSAVSEVNPTMKISVAVQLVDVKDYSFDAALAQSLNQPGMSLNGAVTS